MATATEVERLPEGVKIIDVTSAIEIANEAALQSKRLAASFIGQEVRRSLAQRNRNRVHDIGLGDHLKGRSIDQVVVSKGRVQDIGKLLAQFSDDDRKEIRQMVYADLQLDHATSSFSVRFSDEFKDEYLKVKRMV